MSFITGSMSGPSSEKALEQSKSLGSEGSSFNSINPRRGELTDEKLIHLARQAFESGSSWFDASVRRGMEDAISAFNSRHPTGSKYYTKEFAKRSRLFRPRTRASIRKLEAATATALFATTDVVTAEAGNKNNKRNVLAAQIKESILRTRLTQRGSIPWFTICQGAAQTAYVTGTVASCQEWEFRETPDGQRLADRPIIRLIANENIIIDPACDWSDPAQTTNYLIERMPYSIAELVAKIENDADKQSKSAWRQLSDGQIESALKNYWDSLRNEREGQRQDRYENDTAVGDFRTVWVHRHIMRMRDGVDYVFETLGTEFMLSREAVPVWEFWPIKGRPYVLGGSIIEAHKLYCSSPAMLGLPVQEETNELTNQTMDNIKQVVNRRKYLRRGAAIDIHALKANTPGSAVFMSDPRNDVVEPDVKDVTSSAFQERDRLTAEFDDVMGTQTGASVAQRRRLDETVGGQQMLGDNIDPVTELTVRTFVESWVEPVLAQVMDWIEVFENDERLLGRIAANTKMSIEGVIGLLAEDTDVVVNVGFGATNPSKRLERLRLAVGAAIELGGEQMQQQIDIREIVIECFGAAGYKDGSRFFPGIFETENPQIAQLEQQLQEMQQVLEMKTYEWDARKEIEQIKADGRLQVERLKLMSTMDLDKARLEHQRWLDSKKMELSELDYRLKISKDDREKKSLYLQREALSHSIQVADTQLALEVYRTYHPEQPPLEGEPIPHEGERPSMGGDTGHLISSLRKPGSGEIGEPMNLEGDDPAGTLARNDYGMIPGAAG